MRPNSSSSSFAMPRIHHRLCCQLHIPFLLAAALLLSSLSFRAAAQELYGTILGTVADSSGARISKAEIIVTNIETGNVHNAVSNGSGEYRIEALAPGTYSVTIKNTGFGTFLNPNVAVALNSEVRINAALTVGSQNQVVTVEADSAILQTDRADVHTTITSKELVDLPQPTRTYETLVGLTPGVNPPTGGFAGAGGTNNPGRSVIVEANGTSNSGTDVRIDGVSAVNGWVQYYSTAVPSTEAIQAVNVVTGSADAEQSLAGGATVNVEIKSGTNNFHGEIYEYHEDNALKARPYAFTTAQSAARKPKLVDNDFGGTLGGPIKRNKLFSFVSYEGDFTSQQGTAYQTIPNGTSGPGQTPTGERVATSAIHPLIPRGPTATISPRPQSSYRAASTIRAEPS